jgi:Kef-type K+ transport system membrane component KefB
MTFLSIPVASFFHRPLTNPVLVFAFLLIVILVSPIVLRRLNIPGIIGLIVAGIIIGPHGLNLIEKSDAVELFATIGLLYIMFIAGLDLDLVEFARNKNKSILFGFFTFIIPLIIGFPVCYFILKLDFLASLLISSMFSTHTLVAYPIVSKMGVNKNQAVATTVGGTIITDTAVLLLLAIIIGSWQGQLDKTFFIRLFLGLLVQILFVFLIIPKISHWFFKKLESEKYSHYIFVLSMVFMSAFCSELAGIEPIIGAFLAGLTFSRIIPHTSALMNRIEFIGNSLFIPFFLLSVGMYVNMVVIFKGKTAIFVALSLTLVALLGKR